MITLVEVEVVSTTTRSMRLSLDSARNLSRRLIANDPNLKFITVLHTDENNFATQWHFNKRLGHWSTDQWDRDSGEAYFQPDHICTYRETPDGYGCATCLYS